MHRVGHQVSFFDPALLPLRQPPHDLPRIPRSCLYRVFLRHLGMKTTWQLHSRFVWFRLSVASTEDLLSACFGGSP
jgi:hypothetical protein